MKLCQIFQIWPLHQIYNSNLWNFFYTLGFNKMRGKSFVKDKDEFCMYYFYIQKCTGP